MGYMDHMWSEHGWGMGFGHGYWMWLWWLVVILAIVALIKYLVGRK